MQHKNKMTSRKKSLIALLFTTNASFFYPEVGSARNVTVQEMCRWLKDLKHQRKMCERRKGLPQLLQQIRSLTVKSCQLQFQYEQWNCSTMHMKKFFKKIYRETAFMYSLATSAFMYVIAQACVEGKLSNCQCAGHPKSDNPLKWDWGGCSVNTKYASTFVEKFLQLKRKGDNPNNIMKYNSEVGLRITRHNTKKVCKCHGLSGSCTQRICYKSLRPFDEVAKNLTALYHKAIQVEPDNNIHDISRHKKKKQLLFLDSSPNFCESYRNSAFSTTGRRCRDIDNCATLCCSNDYITVTKLVSQKCNCEWKNISSFQLKCDGCQREETEYYCK
uniref:Protein Wnt n=3 Tax=Dendroctonus ponderosae TaxID=77166 RepID=A0AAR5PFZ9_DENPD